VKEYYSRKRCWIWHRVTQRSGSAADQISSARLSETVSLILATWFIAASLSAPFGRLRTRASPCPGSACLAGRSNIREEEPRVLPRTWENL